jgi:hypothetical protein
VKRVEYGYGFFCGGDPRRFRPDEDSCTPDEIASHKAACERWEAGDTTALPGSCIRGEGFILTLSGFGIGSYDYDADDPAWFPRVFHIIRPPKRTPRRLKKNLKRSGARLTEYGWTHGDPVGDVL